jgi:hypothetical protein
VPERDQILGTGMNEVLHGFSVITREALSSGSTTGFVGFNLCPDSVIKGFKGSSFSLTVDGKRGRESTL